MADSLTAWLKENLMGRPAPAAPPEDDSFRFQPGESTGHAMLRYGGNELLGAARSPLDLAKNLAQAPQAVWQGYTQAIPALLRDPSLLTEAPRAAVTGASSLAMHPEELGSLLGQTVVGRAVPEVVQSVKTLRGRTGMPPARPPVPTRAAAPVVEAAPAVDPNFALSGHAVDINAPVREFNVASEASQPADLGGNIGRPMSWKEIAADQARRAAERAAKRGK